MHPCVVIIAKSTKKKESRHSSFSLRAHKASALFDQMEFLSPNYLSARNSDQGSTSQRGSFQREYTPIRSAVDSVTYIADHLRNEEADQQVIEDWKYVSVVMDRVFLTLFTSACVIGTGLIILMAPTIYDTTKPLA
uniref:Neurotransmitter-gated ion-channel transmembrane domain-containing protein n=1 Tax=Acrobeloides nanus TaxID=290746 RepID=A0A914CNU8_9BILA